MEILMMNPKKLKPYDKNPRNNENSIAKVAESIKEFGFRQPIVVDERMVVIAGHTRLQAAKLLELNEVPVHIATGLTEAQILAYRLADNRTADDSEWNHDLLAQELMDIIEMDFDVSVTGFTQEEIDRIFHKPEEDEEPKEKEFKSTFEVVVTCEDETDQEAIFKLMTSKGYRCRVLSM